MFQLNFIEYMTYMTASLKSCTEEQLPNYSNYFNVESTAAVRNLINIKLQMGESSVTSYVSSLPLSYIIISLSVLTKTDMLLFSR